MTGISLHVAMASDFSVALIEFVVRSVLDVVLQNLSSLMDDVLIVVGLLLFGSSLFCLCCYKVSNLVRDFKLFFPSKICNVEKCALSCS
jgi:hypothetical protein